MLRLATRSVFALACALQAWASCAEETVTVRVLPQPLATNREPFRIGLEMGFPAERISPLKAECLADRPVAAETNVTVETLLDRDTGKPVYRVMNAGAGAGGVIFESAALRKGVGYTVRLRCRLVKGAPSLIFRYMPMGEPAGSLTEKTSAVKGGAAVEKAFTLKPRKDGACRCGFLVEAGGVMDFSDFSMTPDDAEGAWSGPALEALRAAELAAVRWPVAKGLAQYDWYQGVGPEAMRRPPASGQEAAAAFGTAEFVRFCRLIGAEPVLRVTVPPCVRAGVDAERTREEIQRAADWVAYCNAPTSQPLARLRARHGCAEPLRVRRWELFAPEGELFAGVLRRYQEAAEAADQADGVALVAAEAPLAGVRDRYVEEILRRLQAADPAERAYYSEWFEALSVANDALARLRAGSGVVFWPDPPERVLGREPAAKRMLAERGQLIALFNRFPAGVPLATEGVSASPQSPLQVVAAWSANGEELIVYVYNSGTEPLKLRLDVSALKRTFSFWASEQLAGDLTARHTAESLPVLKKQKAGSALSQAVRTECLPASITRLVVK